MAYYGQVCTKCEHEFNDVRPMNECDIQPACPICGAQSVRDYASRASQTRPEQVSDAMGIHPSQVPEALKRFPHHRYNSQGQMLFSSNGEMQRALKDLGFVDKNRH